MLSSQQFASLASRIQPSGGGGFTVNVRTGHEPTQGYAVSVPGHEETIDPVASATGEDIEKYADRHGPALMPADAHLGGWHDTGKGYLDVSRVHPTREEGYVHMVANNQYAMANLADVANDGPEPFVDNPARSHWDSQPAGARERFMRGGRRGR